MLFMAAPVSCRRPPLIDVLDLLLAVAWKGSRTSHSRLESLSSSRPRHPATLPYCGVGDPVQPA